MPGVQTSTNLSRDSLMKLKYFALLLLMVSAVAAVWAEPPLDSPSAELPDTRETHVGPWNLADLQNIVKTRLAAADPEARADADGDPTAADDDGDAAAGRLPDAFGFVAELLHAAAMSMRVASGTNSSLFMT